MIAIVDYGVGNLFSLSSSVKSLGAEVCVTRDADDLRAADHILLPGVGAFADAMAKLEATGLVPVLREETQKKPLLGICLGMQLLFEKSYEYGEHAGLGLIPGAVCPLADDLADPPFLCCALCRGCGLISFRCWPRITGRWCWRVSASAACRAENMAPCLPSCAAGARAGGWRCLQRRFHTRAATLPFTR